MTTTTTKLSASDFTDPLIRTLGELTGFQADKWVPFEDTFQPIMDRMGIESLDQYGYQDRVEKKRPWVPRWIGFAFRNARVVSDDGNTPALTHQVGRGKWALTDAGVQRARELAGIETVTVADEDCLYIDVDDPKLDAAVVANSAFSSFSELVKNMETHGYVPTLRAEYGEARWNDINLIRDALILRGLQVHPDTLPIPEPLEVSKLGLGVQLPLPAQDLLYHEDPYIVALAAEQTQCFGAFSPRSNVCERCPLQRSCLNVVRGKLVELAQGFRSKAEQVTEKEETEAVLQAAYETHHVKRDPAWDRHNAESITNTTGSECVCYRCNETISKGVKAYWHRPSGSMFHEECY